MFRADAIDNVNRVLTAIQNSQNPVRLRHLVEATALSRSVVCNHLNTLERLGYIKRHRPARGTSYSYRVINTGVV